ncbi:hypothetical protein GCM10020254_34740 [Streptomyces goshikiensis]
MLVAEEQTAGRGRLDRSWVAPARSGLFFSVLLKPGAAVPQERWGWLTLLAGVAAATGLSRAAGVDTALKWPNDLLVIVDGEERKTGGILAERVGDGVVLGIGLNVTLTDAELPVPEAGSLALAKASVTDREPLLKAVLRSLEEWYGEWRAAGGDPAASGLQGDVRGGLRHPRPPRTGGAARRPPAHRNGRGGGRGRTARRQDGRRGAGARGRRGRHPPAVGAVAADGERAGEPDRGVSYGTPAVWFRRSRPSRRSPGSAVRTEWTGGGP